MFSDEDIRTSYSKRDNFEFIDSKVILKRDLKVLRCEFLDLFHCGEYSDFEIFCSDGSIKVHKLIIGASSDFLFKLLKENENICSLIIPDYSLKDLTSLLYVLYGGDQFRTVNPLLASLLRIKNNENIIHPIEEPEDLLSSSEKWSCSKCSLSLPSSVKCIGSHICQEFQITKFETFDDPTEEFEELLKTTHTVLVPNHDQEEPTPPINFKKSKNKTCQNCFRIFNQYSDFLKHRTLCLSSEDRLKESLITLESQEMEDVPDETSSSQSVYSLTFSCDTCAEVFPTKSALSYHQMQHQQSFPCKECPAKFLSARGLEYHMKKHLGIKEYLCDDCGARFENKSKLSNHRKFSHLAKKSYICDQCGDGFTRSDKLTVHKRRAHTGERPYKCEHCDYRGVDSSSLVHHRKRHKNEIEKNKYLKSVKYTLGGIKTPLSSGYYTSKMADAKLVDAAAIEPLEIKKTGGLNVRLEVKQASP